MAASRGSFTDCSQETHDEENVSKWSLLSEVKSQGLPLKRKRSAFTVQHASEEPNSQQRKERIEQLFSKKSYPSFTYPLSLDCSNVGTLASKGSRTLKQAPSPETLYDPFDGTAGNAMYDSNLVYTVSNLPDSNPFEYSMNSIENSRAPMTYPNAQKAGRYSSCIEQPQIQRNTVRPHQSYNPSSTCNTRSTVSAFLDPCSPSTAFESSNQNAYLQDSRGYGLSDFLKESPSRQLQSMSRIKKRCLQASTDHLGLNLSQRESGVEESNCKHSSNCFYPVLSTATNPADAAGSSLKFNIGDARPKSNVPENKFGSARMPTQALISNSKLGNYNVSRKDVSSCYEFFSAYDPPCDTPCDEDCEGEDCSSCDESQICCEPCTNPEMCSSGDCDKPECFREPQEICFGHHTPRFSRSLCETPVSPRPSYVNPQHLFLNCQWETSGQQCEALMPSVNTLSEHVLQDHIQPQAVLPCQWNHCSNQVELDDIPSHVWQCHSPASEAASFVCLWHGCGASFLTTEELDTHMKELHCQISCHWDGCDQATTSEMALKAHVDNKHITKATACSPRESTPTTITLSTPKSYSEHPFNVEKPSTITPSPDNQQSPQGNMLGHRSFRDALGNAGEKSCQWLVSDSICGQVFENGNELQAHIESSHLNNSKHCGTFDCRHMKHLCKWNGCKTSAPFAERSKLARHIYTHTKFMVGACRYCGKEYNNQNQLADHERTHTKEKPFSCGKCGFKTTTKAALNTHMRIHTGEKPLRCDKCSYTCGDPSNMSKHRKTHEEPLHKCELCEKAFCRSATLKRHMLSHDTKNTD